MTLTAPKQSPITFPIDLVYTWVDGSDPAYQAQRAPWLGPDVEPFAIDPARWKDNHELLYSLRTVHRFAPWIRRIFIITNGQTPKWLDVSHEKIRMVNVADIVPKKYLPTFNSVAIECHMHRIPGLAEHFIYANDDNFLGAPVTPHEFYSSEGRMNVWFDESPMRPILDLTRHKAKANAVECLTRIFGPRPWRRPVHQMHAYTQSLWKIFDLQFPALVDETSSERFRGPRGIAFNLVFAHNYACLVGLGITQTSRPNEINISPGADPAKTNASLARILAERPMFFCLNGSLDIHASQMREFWQSFQTFPAPWEFEPPKETGTQLVSVPSLEFHPCKSVKSVVKNPRISSAPASRRLPRPPR